MLETPTASKSRLAATLRFLIAAAVVLTVARVWLGPAPILPRAEAQLPNPAKQRDLLLEEAKRTNQLLTDIKALLESGTLNVRLRGADNQSDEAERAPARP